MHKLGIFGIYVYNIKYYFYIGENGEVKGNLLLEKEIGELKHKTIFKRDFETSKANEKWTTDVSEFKNKNGILYLSPTLDMYDQSIISYGLSKHPEFGQTKRMIDKTFK